MRALSRTCGGARLDRVLRGITPLPIRLPHLRPARHRHHLLTDTIHDTVILTDMVQLLTDTTHDTEIMTDIIHGTAIMTDMAQLMTDTTHDTVIITDMAQMLTDTIHDTNHDRA